MNKKVVRRKDFTVVFKTRGVRVDVKPGSRSSNKVTAKIKSK